MYRILSNHLSPRLLWPNSNPLQTRITNLSHLLIESSSHLHFTFSNHFNLTSFVLSTQTHSYPVPNVLIPNLIPLSMSTHPPHFAMSSSEHESS